MNLSRPQTRAAINRANSLHSTGPRTTGGKRRSSQNALTHGLTARATLLATEDHAAFEQHRAQFLAEYQPQGPTETQLVQELIDTSWRLNRIPALEADLLARAATPTQEFDIVDAHRLLASLSLNSARLSRQFQKALDQLRDIQSDRRRTEERHLARAAALLEMHKAKGLPYDPAADGFVFSIEQIEAHSRRLIRLNQSHHIEHVKFYAAGAGLAS